MPIKFRCRYCQQLLGIAQNKAGSTVDCPACGRTLRVPVPDGHSEAASPARREVHDASLLQALDELAQIGEIPPGEAEVVDASVSLPPLNSPKPTAPVALPAQQPVPTELPLDSFSQAAGVLAELAATRPPAVGAPHGKPSSAAAISTDQSSFPKRVAGYSGWKTLWAVGGVSLVLGFGAGYEFARLGTISPQPVTEQTSQNPGDATPTDPLLHLQVRYLHTDGQLKPDQGAVVIVLPAKHPAPQPLWPGNQLRPGTPLLPETVQQVADSGGVIVLLTEQGTATMSVPQAGTYQVYVLSHYAGQPTGTGAATETLRELGHWWADPAQFVGRRALWQTTVELTPAKPVALAHDFRQLPAPANNE